MPTNHNYLNISIIRKMLANSYIISKKIIYVYSNKIHSI